MRYSRTRSSIGERSRRLEPGSWNIPAPFHRRARVYLDMAATPPTALATLPSAFAAACRLSRTEGELFERCRVALVRRFQSEHIWLTLVSPSDQVPRVGPARGFEDAQEVARLGSGETEVVIHADATVAPETWTGRQVGQGAR